MSIICTDSNAEKATLQNQINSLQSKLTAMGAEVTKHSSGDFATVNSEKETAVSSALAEQQRLHDSVNAILCQSVQTMANQLNLA